MTLLVFTGLYVVFTLGKIFTLLGAYRMRRLDREQRPEPAHWPSLTVVIAARNEERSIEHAVESVLQIDYPNLEVLVVNDRSTDKTGELLQQLARRHSHLSIVDITELPAGWLGKNHALDLGARKASGEWILFTDADVVFSPRSLKRAISYALYEKLDHLPMLMRAWSRSFMVDAFIPYFGIQFMLYVKPWLARDPEKKNRYVGIGAFNMVKKSVLEKIGYFRKLPMRPDDDVKLGKVIKQSGFRQECLVASKDLSVEWYTSLKECVQGLEKNLYAGTDYNLLLAFLAFSTGLFTTLWPALLLVFTQGALFYIVLGTFILEGIVMIVGSSPMRKSPSRVLMYPLSAVLFSFIALRTTVKNIVDGGIYWRDTFYPLDELKKNKV